jgi:hypothetical protein
MRNYNPITRLVPIVSLNPLDVLPIVDVTDLTQSPVGSTKKVTIQQIQTYIETANPWIVATSSPIDLVPNQGYIVDGSTVILFILPATANVGDEYYIEGLGPNLFQINQRIGQQIVFDSSATSIGPAGRIVSTNPGDGLTIMCTVANTTFKVRSSIGTLITI